MTTRKKSEPGLQINRATFALIAAAGAAIAALYAGATWLNDHWVTSDKFKAHQKVDINVRDWTQYGLASNRLSYLEDKQYECEAKRTAGDLGKKSDIAICAHYEARASSTKAEADKLKSVAMDGAKEKVE